VAQLIGQLSATSLVCTFVDLPKPVFTTVLGLELGVEIAIMRRSCSASLLIASQMD
jgi:hypothetical protein